MKNKHGSTSGKITAGIILLIVLSIALSGTTFALVYSMVTVDNNVFRTGVIDINLNDGKPVIEEHEFEFRPGMAVQKEFFLENNSTWSVYYKIYFRNVEGGLASLLRITIAIGDKILYEGTAAEMTRERVAAADDELAIGERRNLTVTFLLPWETGNEGQGQLLAFDLCADAVQTKNNRDRLFY